MYGVSVGNGIVRETDSDRMLPGTQNFILPSLSTHKYAKEETTIKEYLKNKSKRYRARSNIIFFRSR